MMSEDLRRLLIVEDNPTDVMILQRALREQGVNVETVVVDDGEKAIEYLQNCPETQTPHLVVIDINLPKRDGIEVLHTCRFRPGLVETKTLMLTSSDEPCDHSRSDMLGADAYLRKPNHLDGFAAVVSTIRNLLEIKGLAAGGSVRSAA
jgi:DNA-binding response OmpR family regulator